MRRVLVTLTAGVVLGAVSTLARAEAPPYRCGTATRTFTSEPSQRTITEGVVREFSIDVAGMGPLVDLDVVTDIRSSRSGDLEIVLVPPLNTFGPELVLTRGNGGSVADAFARVTWDDQAGKDGLAPITDIDFTRFAGRRLPPQVPLARGLGGTPNGTWTLRIRDLATNGSTASLVSWSLVLTSASGSPFQHTDTVPAQVLTTYTPLAQGTQTAAIQINSSTYSARRVLEVAVRTSLPHADSGQYDVVLRSPSGTTVTLTSDNGDRIANAFGDVQWSDRAGLPVTLTDLTPPVGRRELAPEEPLGAFIGEPFAGTWTLEVTDDTAGTAGAPFSWELLLTSSECADIAPSVEAESITTGPRNDTTATATPLTLVGNTVARAFGQVVEAQAGSSADADYWSFEAPANARVWVLAQARPRSFPAFQGGVRVAVGDVNGAIYDTDQSDGTLLQTGAFGGGDRATPSIAGQPLPTAGRHIIRVEPVAGAGEVPYELFVVVSALPPISPPAIQPIALAFYGRPVATARGTTSDGPDSYRVSDVVPGSLVLVSIDGDPDRTGSISNPSLSIQDGSATPVTFNRSSSAPHAEAVVVAPANGTVTITVADGGSAGAYAITTALIRGPNEDLRLTRTLRQPATVDGMLDVEYLIEAATPDATDVQLDVSYASGLLQGTLASVTTGTGACELEDFLGFLIRCPLTMTATGTVRIRAVIPPTEAGPLQVTAVLVPRQPAGFNDPPAAMDYRFDDNIVSDPIPLVAPSANLTMSVVRISNNAAQPGQRLLFDAQFSNVGPSTARAVAVTCALPAIATFVSIDPFAGGVTCLAPTVDATTGTSAVSCSAPSLSVLPAGIGAVSFEVGIRPTAVGPAVGELRCSVTSATPDPTLPGNTKAVGFAVIGSPSPTDTDGDGLTDAFEQQWGFDPADPQNAEGAASDPDGDGVTTFDEQAAGTHPTGVARRYFAEGATGPFFDTRLAILHPDASTEPARVQVRYLRPAPLPPVVQDLIIPAQQRHTIDVESIPGLESTAVSIVVESDRLVLADRTMSWDTSGYGSHGETGVTTPATTWFLAEGSTLGDFNLFYLLQNPNPQEAMVTVRYLRPAPLPAIERTYTVGANARFNIWVNLEGPEFASTDVSAAITSTLPIIVERAMYLDRPGQPFGAGHAGTASRLLDTEWFLAEGATGAFFDLFILLANPGDTAADVRLDYLRPDGTVVTRQRTVAPNSRQTVWVDFEDPSLASTAVSTVVTSTNGVDIVVERAMWWPGDSSTWHEAHASLAARGSARRWGLAEGQVGGTRDEDTYVLVANVDDVEGEVAVTLHFEDGTGVARSFPLLAKSRLNVHVRTEFPEAAGRRFGTVIASRALPGATTAAPLIIVEQALYWNQGPAVFAAGSNLLGTPLP